MRDRSQSATDVIEQVDIVICVHNALAHVERCLDAVTTQTSREHGLIIIDDGSNEECRTALRQFAQHHPHCTLICNESARGYTKSANQGLRASPADLIVLLNSDTIVTPDWLERLVECAENSPAIGIVGPLSNAAVYQSVPKRFDAAGEFALNPLPPNWSPEQVAHVIATISPRAFPRVPFVNGFCFAIKRAVIERIGYFDEENFPFGYGEEDDYCLRATAAGIQLAIADHVYVYHAKSRSYSPERRRSLKRQGSSALLRKHGQRPIDRGLLKLDHEPTLAAIRQQLTTYLAETSPPILPSC